MARHLRLDREKMITLYVDEKLSANEIAKVMGGDRNMVYYYLDKAGIARRSLTEARRISISRGNACIAKPGPLHWNWHGGKSKYNGGYVKILIHGHAKADSYGYVAEHLLVWEETHGTTLPEGWVIHHLNGIKDDNRSENLVALPKQSHNMLVKEIRRRLRIVEKELSILKKQKLLF